MKEALSVELKFDHNISIVLNDKFIEHLNHIFPQKKIKQVIPIKANIYAILIENNDKDLWYLIMRNKKKYFYFNQQASSFMELMIIFTGYYYSSLE